MGKKDIAEKSLLAYNDVFADIVDALVFKGEKVVKEQDLEDAKTDSLYRFSETKSQIRDVAKFWQNGTIRIGCIGFENQTRIDTDMAIRVLSYDASSYRSQLDDKSQKKRYPVLTLVLYFGTEQKWEKNTTLFERVKICDERLLPFLNDYKINVFNLAWLADDEILSFQSDFRDVLEYLRAVRLKTAYEGSQKKVDHIEAILDLFKALSGNARFDEIKANIISAAEMQGGIKMFDVFQATMDKGFALGRSEGINDMASLMARLYEQGRDEDMKRAFRDKAYLMRLLNEQASPASRKSEL